MGLMCSLDGEPMQITQNDQATFCVPEIGLSNGTHFLNVTILNSSTVLFDSITYAATEGTSVGDVLYYSDDPSIKVSPPVPFGDSADFPPGRSVDIDFVGECQVWANND